MENGTYLNQEEVLARHPEFAIELEEFFANRTEVDRLATPLRDVANTASCGSQGWDQAQSSSVSLPCDWGDTDGVPAKEVRSFGDYDLLEQIGQGGMGIVFKVHQKSLHRQVALKMIRGGHQ